MPARLSGQIVAMSYPIAICYPQYLASSHFLAMTAAFSERNDGVNVWLAAYAAGDAVAGTSVAYDARQGAGLVFFQKTASRGVAFIANMHVPDVQHVVW